MPSQNCTKIEIVARKGGFFQLSTILDHFCNEVRTYFMSETASPQAMSITVPLLYNLKDMEEILSLVVKVFPLYVMVFAGYVAGKLIKLSRETIASLLIYVIAPVVFFYGVAIAPVNNAYLLLPILFFIVANVLSLTFYRVGKLFWKTSEKNLLSAAAGSANTGYFGLPLVLALVGEQGLSIAIFCLLGTSLYESTRSYYVLARSNASAKEAVMKVLKLPIIYAFILGLIVNRLGVTIDGSILEAFVYFKGAYVVFGMMIIGLVLATANKGHFDTKFTSLAFLAKFIGYPALIGGFVFLDSAYFELFDTRVHTVMMLLAIVPMAANTITYAAFLKVHPEKAAVTVMASTLFALLYIPIFISIFLK